MHSIQIDLNLNLNLEVQHKIYSFFGDNIICFKTAINDYTNTIKIQKSHPIVSHGISVKTSIGPKSNQNSKI